MTASAIYQGFVTHRRVGAPAHGFRYPLYMLLLDLDELPQIDERSWLFGHNRRRPVSFRDEDHLVGPVLGVRDRLRALVEARGSAWPGGAVRLLTHARVLGYVFNPVSFYFCHDPEGSLALVVAEVSNTYGERHCYVLDGRHEAAGLPRAARAWRSKKVFHVSPFRSLDGTYEFEIEPPAQTLDVRIVLRVGEQARFAARLSLTRQPFTDGAMARALLRYPLMTLQVIGAIHWEAWRLWRKGATFHAKPPHDPSAVERETLA